LLSHKKGKKDYLVKSNATLLELPLEGCRNITKFLKSNCFQEFQAKAHQYVDLLFILKSTKKCSMIRIIAAAAMAIAQELFGFNFSIES
jgi:hypothetical protein